MNLDLVYLEQQLKKRWQYPYRWGKHQNNADDALSNWIYSCPDFEQLLEQASTLPEAQKLYTMNRWYNFWSAKAVEQIFLSAPSVQAAANAKDKTKDFFISDIPFDHKSTVFPKAFPHSLAEAQAAPQQLIEWLYTHQSQEGRYHRYNRLFVVLYAQKVPHWYLKAELGFLSNCIENYLAVFEAEQLIILHWPDGNSCLSDVVWAVQSD